MTSTLADRDRVVGKTYMNNGVMLHVGVGKGDIFHSSDSNGCYRFIKVFMCLLLGFFLILCICWNILK